MGSKRKYYFTDGGTLRASDKPSFLVYWQDDTKQLLSRSRGPYADYKEAEQIMVEHLISGVCSWIVSYNG